MELRHLEHFLAVAEEGHFTRAAARVRVSQSGLSASVRALEHELRAPLFLRSTRRVRLTEAGRALLTEAEQVLAGVRAAREAVAAVQGVLRGTLRLGTEQCVSGVRVPELLAAFRSRHPEVEIRLRQTGSAVLLDELGAGRIDLAFTAGCGVPRELRSRPLAAEPLRVLCPPHHPLPLGREAVPWGALAGEVFVDFPTDWGPRRAADAGFAAAGVGREVALEVTDVHSLLELVQQGLGIAVVPRHFTAKPEAAGLAALPLVPTGGGYASRAVFPPEDALAPAAAALLALLPAAETATV